ncbi:MAG: efflux RND transporter permease subunit [Planctomycetaceae bacterium]|nr:efflux RND transporter permease subunit [Planctomycetaceae bacterium]MCB9949925.1 efflux RND transporter permease subunit [Planctomycetaceae bacterium]
MSLPRFSVNNPVMVNMFMIVTLVAGAAFAATLVREMFPESRPNQIAIVAVYPATQPDELERAVTIKVEEAIRDVDGVEKVDSRVSEGMTATTLTLYNWVKDVDVVLQEVKNEIDALQDLPDDLEKITVTKIEPTLPVIMVAVYGDGSEADLKRAARDIRDDLLELPGVSDVRLGGLRDDEISIEIRPEKLVEYDITFEEVAFAVRQENLDVSGGNLKGERSQVAVRTIGEERRGVDLEDLEVRALPDGRVIRLRDVADVRDQFVDTDVRSYWDGKRSASLIVQKTASQDAIQISSLVKAYISGKSGETFDPNPIPENAAWWTAAGIRIQGALSNTVNKIAGRPDPYAVYEESRKNPFQHEFQVAAHTDLARFVEGRLDLMLRNGRMGLVLVLISLMLFLNWRVAFWTAVGLPVSFLGTFIVMALMGVSLNLLSMFGLIIVLGIIVDDAIVIGENIYRRVEEGMPAQEAAVKGAEEVMWPVIVAVSTTIAAFLPLMFIRGRIGDFFRELPLVVIAALSVSLFEALLILPAHLSHIPRGTGAQKPQSGSWFGRMGALLDSLQSAFLTRLLAVYGLLLKFALRWRYAAFAVAISCFIMTLGLLFGKTSTGMSIGNVVQWQFIQKMDAESMYAQIEMPVGTKSEVVEERMRVISDAASRIPEVKSVSMDVAVILSVGGEGSASGNSQSHVGQVWVELLASDFREEQSLRSSQDVLAELRETTEHMTGVNSVKWQVMSGGPAGKDIEIRISGGEFTEIQEVADELKQHLQTYDGVVDLDDDFDVGKREVQLSLRSSARPTGVTEAALGSHVRSATYGAEAKRITRNREDVKIMVRYPEEFRADVYNIESMWLPTPTGQDGKRGWIPLREVAYLEETRGYTQIHRAQQRRALTVFGDIDDAVTTAGDVVDKVKREYIPQVLSDHPQLHIEFLGSQEDQAKSFSSLRLAFPVALLIIYMMLAGLFRSYIQPIVVMTAIPFGVQGAIIGHWLTGNPMTILSMIGLVALTGIVVNDSLVLVDFINKRIREGQSPFQASVEGATLRLRPILLTTLTTAAGLAPMMFEKSFQAKFLIPMAVTLTWGLVFATVLTLLIVPVINLIFFDVLNIWNRLWGVAPPENEAPTETVVSLPS